MLKIVILAIILWNSVHFLLTLIFKSIISLSCCRYIECLVYGIRSKKDRHWFNMLAFEDTDSALLRLLECFLEATPQLALQLYIMMTLGLQNGWLMGMSC